MHYNQISQAHARAVIGRCPTCREWTSLTKHHDKQIGRVILICRACHDVIEEYSRVQERTRAMGGGPDA